MQDLRRPFFRIIEKLAEEDSKIMLLVGDLGYSYMEDYEQKLHLSGKFLFNVIIITEYCKGVLL
tara:strand:- start:72 stop:263 length:192 start_codon:yes stop_codon:yes gene_type:complete